MWQLLVPVRHRVAVTLSVALALSVGVGAVAHAQDDERTDDAPRPAIIDARERAEETVTEYVATYGRLAELQGRLETIREELPVLEERVRTLHRKLQRRAAELYKDGSSAGGLAIFDEDPATASRRADLGRAMARSDSTDMDELLAAKARLDRRVAVLEASEAEYDALLVLLEEQHRQIQDELVELTGGLGTDARLCPVQGPVLFTNDWGQPRSGDRTHQGNDMFSPTGAENVAIVAGTIRQGLEALGGLVVYLDGDDGHTYYYAHLSRFEGPPRRVEPGEVIGYTGDTGNAIGGAPHTHFEIHEDGAKKINPYPILRGLCLIDEADQ